MQDGSIGRHQLPFSLHTQALSSWTPLLEVAFRYRGYWIFRIRLKHTPLASWPGPTTYIGAYTVWFLFPYNAAFAWATGDTFQLLCVALQIRARAAGEPGNVL